jgi:hypothetical protein
MTTSTEHSLADWAGGCADTTAAEARLLQQEFAPRSLDQQPSAQLEGLFTLIRIMPVET